MTSSGRFHAHPLGRKDGRGSALNPFPPRPRRREPQREHDTATVGVSDGHLAAEQSSDAPADGETQSIAVCGSHSRVGDTEEFLENFLVQVGRNTGTGISNFDSGDFSAIGRPLRIHDAHANVTTRRRVLDRVRYEVGEYLANAQRVGHQRRGLRVDSDVDATRRRRDCWNVLDLPSLLS